MKVKVLIEYDFPELDSLPQSQREVIEDEVIGALPGAFEIGDDEFILARSISAEVVRELDDRR